MGKYDDAAETLDRQVAKLQGLTEARDALRAMGQIDSTLESGKAEMVRVLDALQTTQSDLSRGLAELQTCEERIEQARRTAADLPVQAQRTSQQIVEKARQQGVELIHEASLQAATELAALRAQKDANVADITAKIDAAQQEYRQVLGQIQTATDQLDRLHADVTDARTELNAMKAMARKLVG